MINFPVNLEQTCNLAVRIDVNVERRWGARQTRHRHDLASLTDNKACTCADAGGADVDVESGRSAELLRVVREAVLRFGNADRTLSEAELGERLKLLFCRRTVNAK